MERFAIVTAGGAGLRFGAPVPKQFLTLAGVPLVVHAARAFLAFDPNITLLVTLPPAFIPDWENELPRLINAPVTLVPGGQTRFHSVKNAVDLLPSFGWVAVHDGARPLVRASLVESCFAAAAVMGNAVPAIRPADSLRILSGGNNGPLDRDRVRLIQTPQVFRCTDLKEAYQQNPDLATTDDAQCIEAIGQTIHLIEGDRQNFKITLPEDLIFAEALLRQRGV